jgi:hypothetical protein
MDKGTKRGSGKEAGWPVSTEVRRHVPAACRQVHGAESPRSGPRSAAQRRPCRIGFARRSATRGKRRAATTDDRERTTALGKRTLGTTAEPTC